jgi:hypothetical protein
MIHLYVVRQLMHHNHLDLPKAHPAAIPTTKYKLDNLAIVEVATNEFAVGFVFFEGCDGEVVGLRDREALGRNGAEEGVGMGLFCLEGWRAREGFDEGDAVVGMGGWGMVQAKDVYRHLEYWKMRIAVVENTGSRPRCTFG